MVSTQISKKKNVFFNHPKLGNKKIPLILATFGE
jgi:hypothetical protein